jgi:DNA-binding NtrC family response regulator
MLLGDWETMHRILISRDTQRFNNQELSAQPQDQVDEKKRQKKKFPPLKEVKRQAILKAEGEVISEVLKETGWNRKMAAEILQISYKALLYKIKQLNLRPQK